MLSRSSHVRHESRSPWGGRANPGHYEQAARFGALVTGLLSLARNENCNEGRPSICFMGAYAQ